MITFDELVAGLEARPSGQSGAQWSARCPAHEDRSPSFSLTQRDGKLLMHCFRGCEWDAIVEALERRDLWPVAVAAASQQPAPPLDLDGYSPNFLKFDSELKPAENTRADRYLENRGLDLRQLDDIQFHSRAWHYLTDTKWPCMVAAMRDVNGRLMALHRTFLSRTTPTTKAPIEAPRLTLKRFKNRPLTGCAVHLAPAAAKLVLGEGIETTASAMLRFRLPGWAVGGCENLWIPLPPVVREIVLAADNDPKGTGLEQANRAAVRYQREGRQVWVKTPAGFKDFNDLLLHRASPSDQTQGSYDV